MKKCKKSKQISLSCRLELLPGDDTLSKVCHAADFGFDAVALPGRYLDNYIDELKKESDNLPLPLSSISLGFQGSLVSSLSERRKSCRESLITLFDLCEELKVPYFNMPPVLIEDNRDEFPNTVEQDVLLVEQLPFLADEAGKRGVTLLLEPVNRYESKYLNSLGHAFAICEKINIRNLGITADLFHMQMEELNIPDALTDYRRWIKYVHIAENNRQEPGIGSMDFSTAFSALKEIDYDGFLELESRSLSGKPEKSLPRCVDFIHNVWNKAEPIGKDAIKKIIKEK